MSEQLKGLYGREYHAVRAAFQAALTGHDWIAVSDPHDHRHTVYSKLVSPRFSCSADLSSDFISYTFAFDYSSMDEHGTIATSHTELTIASTATHDATWVTVSGEPTPHFWTLFTDAFGSLNGAWYQPMQDVGDLGL